MHRLLLAKFAFVQRQLSAAITYGCALTLFTGLLLVGMPAAAQLNTDTEALQQFVQRAAAENIGAPDIRIEVSVGSVNPRLQLAPCTRTEAFVPPNARLWGRSNVGLRCIEGAQWSVLVPVNVKVFGPALVATRPLMPMSSLSVEDVRVAEVEWTRELQGVASELAHIENRVLTRGVAVGQPIALNALRAPQVVGQGDAVKVVGAGRGFSISATGIALSAAQDGQSVRVRTDTGRVLTGTARTGRVVEVMF